MNPFPTFSSYVIKVASRCNLNCDYCYMYQHADQSWKNKPRCLSLEHQDLFVERLAEYVNYRKLEKILIVHHGGEPLLFGAENIVNFSKKIRQRLTPLGCRSDFGVQTNGTLLKESHLIAFQEMEISVSLSIDGPKEMHDQHRLDLKNKPTFDKVYDALTLLKRYPKIFTGCISVINPHFPPRKLFQFFDENGVSEFNILIPDANYLTLPSGRNENPNLYKNWLIEAFDCWFDDYPHLKCKYFDWLLKSILGHASPTDSFGLGDINLLVLETDGTYHNHDVLKITEENSSALGLSLENNPIADAEGSEKIQFHRHLLTKEGLSQKCQECKHVDVCGGGFIAHRFDSKGYKNPSIYCEELYQLIDHITARFVQKLKIEASRLKSEPLSEFSQADMNEYWEAKSSNRIIESLRDHSARKNYAKLQALIPYAISTFPEKKAAIEACGRLSLQDLRRTLLEPTVNAWLRAFYSWSVKSPVTNIVDQVMPADPNYFETLLEFAADNHSEEFVIQSKDYWYRYSLGEHIILDHDEDEFRRGFLNLQNALDIVKKFDEDLYREMQIVSRHILMVKDAKADPDKDISLSDVTLPGAIFVGVWKASQILSPYMVAASLIHEHLHQKLYLLQNRFELFLPQKTLIYSPWPKVMRPPAAALHAVYVFTHIAHFWNTMLERDLERQLAFENLQMDLDRLDQCISDINNNVKFTGTGQLFFNCLLEKFDKLKTHNLLMQG